MNKQRKVLITITYNEMGIIIDTKAEEVARPNLRPTCDQLATDTISRQAAIEAIENIYPSVAWLDYAADVIKALPSAQSEIIRCKDCKHHHRDNNGLYYCGRKDYGYGWGLNDFCSECGVNVEEGEADG